MIFDVTYTCIALNDNQANMEGKDGNIVTVDTGGLVNIQVGHKYDIHAEVSVGIFGATIKALGIKEH